METTTMSQNDDRFKVVFLTDIRQWSSNNHEEVLDKCTSAVRLSVLKLLTYFAHGSAGQPTHLRWGYKFFNSIDVPPCKREILKEFIESNVEYFEEQLLQEFQAAAARPKRLKSLLKSKLKKKPYTTGESVRHTLSDVFQDFQWEGPDIRSPVKAVSSSTATSVSGRTRNQAAIAPVAPAADDEQSRNSLKSNFVFLLMPCPHHQSNVMEFFGITGKNKKNKHAKIDVRAESTSTNTPVADIKADESENTLDDTKFTMQEFRDYIAPPDGGLPEKLKQNRISLYWIDTAPLYYKDQKVPEGDRHGLSIAYRAMRELGGDVIPITTLLTLNNQDLNLHLQSFGMNRTTSVPIEKPLGPASNESNTDEVEMNNVLKTNSPKDADEVQQKEEEENGVAQSKKANVVSFFPWSSVITRLIRCDAKSAVGSGNEGEEESMMMLCTRKDGQLVPRCQLKMQPIFGHQTWKSNASNKFPSDKTLEPATLPSPSRTSKETAEVQQITSHPINVRSGEVQFQITPCHKTRHGNSATDNRDIPSVSSGSPNGLSVGEQDHEGSLSLKRRSVVIRGILPTQSLFLGTYYDDHPCACTGVALESTNLPGRHDKVQEEEEKKQAEQDEEEDGEEEGEPFMDEVLRLSSWFKKTMIYLNQKKLALLVEMYDTSSGLPISAVLEPLTAVTASLRMIKSNMIRSVESIMHRYHQHQDRSTRKDAEDKRKKGDSGVLSDEVMAMIGKVAKRCVKDKATPVTQKTRRKSTSKATVHAAVMPSSSSSGLHRSAIQAMTHFNPHHLESWYHKGPTHGVPVTFIEHLRGIPEDQTKQCSQTHPALDQLLYDLEVTYENQGRKMEKKKVDTTQEKKETGPKKTMVLAARTKSIMEACLKKKQTKKSPQNKKKKGTAKEASRNDAYVEIIAKGKSKFTNEDDLLKYLQETYNKCANSKSDFVTYTQKTIPVILMFANLKSSVKVKKELNEELVEHARKITAKGLLINNAQLRDKYKDMDEESNERRVKEIEMQVLFRLEMEALLPTVIDKPADERKTDDASKDGVAKEGEEEKEDAKNDLNDSVSEEVTLPDELRNMVDEVVTMLQSIPILVGHSRLATFLEDVVSHYHNTLGTMLKVIYDDLMIAKPEELMSPSQDSQSAKKKPPGSMEPPSSYGSITLYSGGNAPQRTRSLTRHPSFDVGSKRVIPVVIKKEAIKKPKEKKKKVKKEPEEDQAKRVCRNLFSGGGSGSPVRRSPRKKVNPLPRRQSVAIMETGAAVNRWTSPRRRTPGKSPSRLVLKTRVVKETPGKKQVLQAMLRKQEQARKHNKSVEKAAIQESPDKVVLETPHSKKHGPIQSKSGHSKSLTRHPSHKTVFYSKKTPRSAKGKSTRNKAEFSKAIKLGARIAGKTPEPPKPINSTRLLHTRAKSASAVHIFSNFASPGTLLQHRLIPAGEHQEDSPSKNTRSHISTIPEVISSPKSKAKSPNKSPGRRVLWKSSNDPSTPTVLTFKKQSPFKLIKKSPLKKSSSVQTPTKSPFKKDSAIKTPKKSPHKKGTPVKTPKKSPFKNHSPLKTPIKSPLKIGSPVKTPKKLASTLMSIPSTPNNKVDTTPIKKSPSKRTVKKSIQSQLSVSKRKTILSSPLADGSHAMSQTSSPPCEMCSTDDDLTLGSCSTASSSADEVFESPKPSRRRKLGTPELSKVWRQKKPQNGSSPQSHKLLQSPRSTVKSDSPVFGGEASFSKRPSTSPYAKITSSNRPSTSPYTCRITTRPVIEGRLTSSPKFGKQTPSPRARKSSTKSPASARKRSRPSPKPSSAKKPKRNRKSAKTSILSYLDIKGMKKVDDQKDTLLEVADVEHKKHLEERMSRKRGRDGMEDEEDTRQLKKQKSVPEEDSIVLIQGEELFDMDILLDSSDSEEEINMKLPKGTLDLSEGTSDSRLIADLKEFLSPPRKLKQSPGGMLTRKRSSEMDGKGTMDQCVSGAGLDGVGAESLKNVDFAIATNESSTSSQTKTKPTSFRRQPTRRSLAKRMSPENSPTPQSDRLVQSPMFSEDSLTLSSEEDDDDYDAKYLPAATSQRKLSSSSEPGRKGTKFTPISKKGLVDLLNSPLVSNSEKLKNKTRDKGASSRRHVSFSSE